jgi:hypothetical protein
LTRRRAELERIALELTQTETLDRLHIDLLLAPSLKGLRA